MSCISCCSKQEKRTVQLLVAYEHDEFAACTATTRQAPITFYVACHQSAITSPLFQLTHAAACDLLLCLASLLAV
jgi:hypothetical protein